MWITVWCRYGRDLVRFFSQPSESPASALVTAGRVRQGPSRQVRSHRTAIRAHLHSSSTSLCTAACTRDLARADVIGACSHPALVGTGFSSRCASPLTLFRFRGTEPAPFRPRPHDAGENPCHPDQAPAANASTQMPGAALPQSPPLISWRAAQATGPLLRPPGCCASRCARQPCGPGPRRPRRPLEARAAQAQGLPGQAGGAQALPWRAAAETRTPGDKLNWRSITRKKKEKITQIQVRAPGPVTSSQQSHLAKLRHTKPGVDEPDAPRSRADPHLGL